MDDLIYMFLRQSLQSLAVYEGIQEELCSTNGMMPMKQIRYQIISDNCIQMSAVYWCKVFASKKSKTHFSTVEGLDKEVFLSYVKASDISFQAVCDKMRSFRDKYGEGKYSLEEITELFKQAVSVVEAFEHASGTRGLLEEYWKAKNSDRVCAVR